jgi:hypothetical protein
MCLLQIKIKHRNRLTAENGLWCTLATTLSRINKVVEANQMQPSPFCVHIEYQDIFNVCSIVYLIDHITLKTYPLILILYHQSKCFCNFLLFYNYCCDSWEIFALALSFISRFFFFSVGIICNKFRNSATVRKGQEPLE